MTDTDTPTRKDHPMTTPRPLRIQPFEDIKGQPRFRILAANGPILTSSEAYEDARDRDHAMQLIAQGTFEIVDG